MKSVAAVLLMSIAVINFIACSKKSTESVSEKNAPFVEIYLVAHGNDNAAGTTEYRRRISPEILQDNQIFWCEITKDSQTYEIRFEKEGAGEYRYLIGQRRGSEYTSILQGWTSRPESPGEIARVFVGEPSPYRIFLTWGKKEEPGSLQDRINRELDDESIDCVIRTP